MNKDDRIKVLNAEFAENEAMLSIAKKNHSDKVMKIKEEVKSFAKYKVGDFVDADTAWSCSKVERLESGIIRTVCVEHNGQTGLSISYKVGKKTKSGKMHKSHDISYWPIAESKIKLSEKE